MPEQFSDSDHPSSFSGRQLAQELESQPEDVEKLSKDLLRDFYQTFRLAQGEIALQGEIFKLLSRQHQAAEHDVTAAIGLASDQVEKLMPPLRHGETTEEDRSDKVGGFQAMWESYAEALENPESVPDIESVVARMAVRDNIYQKNSRPNRKEDDDLNESILREYILGDHLTGSAELLTVREELREAAQTLLDETSDNREAVILVRVMRENWEKNHPGQTFLLPESEENAQVVNGEQQ